MSRTKTWYRGANRTLQGALHGAKMLLQSNSESSATIEKMAVHHLRKCISHAIAAVVLLTGGVDDETSDSDDQL